jgi:uncharacterized protein YdhG (YjbR/CyaY superfamily)
LILYGAITLRYLDEKGPKDVDTYIGEAPIKVQANLKELRALIKEVAPNAVERISYGMPYYEHKGRLVYFAFAKSHIGLYGLPAPILEEYKIELVPFMAAKATIRLPLDSDLPIELMKKLIKARMGLNEATFH